MAEENNNQETVVITGTDGHKHEVVTIEGLKSSHRKAGFYNGLNKCVCSTAAATSAKTVTVGAAFELVEKAVIYVKFTHGITSENPTLAVTYTDAEGDQQTTQAKPIYFAGAALGAGLVKENMLVELHYNGSQWELVGGGTPSGFQLEYDASDKSLNIIPMGTATASYNAQDKALELNF